MKKENFKHTPGPWIADDLVENQIQRGPGGEQIFKVVSERGGLIADVSSWWVDRKSAKQNARLIAAAPDMLATCEWVLQEIWWGHDMAASAAILKQVIKKALGE